MLKRAARRIGQLVTISALVFLAWALYQQRADMSDWTPTAAQIALVFALTLAYTAALVLLALNWATIVQTLVPQSPPRAPLLLSYTKTQIAKYVPGNVVHLVSRHMYLKNFGLDHRPLATASLLELVSLPLAAIIAMCLTITFTDGASAGVWALGAFAPLALFAAVGIATLAIYPARPSWRRPAVTVLTRGVAFMVCQGAIFAVVLYTVSGSFVALAIPAAIFAWLVGFLTPGSPGGIAVREALLINLLAHLSATDDVLIAALLLRVITAFGDLVLYLFGNLIVEKFVPGTHSNRSS